MLLNNKIIRFRKKGHKHYKVYDIVLIFRYKRNRADFLDKIGFFNPNLKEKIFFVDLDKLGFWLNRGASLHNTLKKYLVKFIIF